MNDLTGKRRGARNRVQELRDSILDGTIGLTMEDVQDVVGELRDSILDGTIGLTPEGVQDVVGGMIVGAGGAYDDAAGTITLPAGPPGNPSAYELRGTGMPNGVVTASPGTYYTDTAGTNGAWRWLKTSGTGNTGWVVVYGDTGWRSVTAPHEMLGTLIVGTAYLRRTADTVFVTSSPGSAAGPAGLPGGSSVILFKPGWGAGGYGVHNPSPMRIGSTGTVSGVIQSGEYYGTNIPANATLRFGFAYPAETLWPTTLPGVPA